MLIETTYYLLILCQTAWNELLVFVYIEKFLHLISYAWMILFVLFLIISFYLVEIISTIK